MKRFVIAILACFCVIPGFSRGYNISVEVKGTRDSTMLLAIYFGEKQFAIDTTVLDANGKAVFSNVEPLEAGMYLVIMGRSILFDLLISNEDSQNFSVSLDVSLKKVPEFIGSQENTSFYQYHAFKNDITRKRQEIDKLLMDTGDTYKLDSLNTESAGLRKSLAQYSDSVANKYSGKTISIVLNALNVPEPPEVNIPRDDPKRDSIIYMNYYSYEKDHFFDRIDLSDERLARTPFFESMLIYYFDYILLYKQTDSIVPYVDRVIEQASRNDFMFRYVLSNLFNHYMRSKIMGQEGVVAHLAEKYYINDERTNWETEKFMQDITNFVNRTKPTLLGEKAPDLSMETLSGQYESISGIDTDFLVVYFYEPNCGFCKTETSKVFEIYKKFRDKGVQVFAVYTQQDKEEWTGYVAEKGLDWINVWDPQNRNDFREKYNVYTTPQLYVLDKDKRVVGRRLDSENMEKMLINLTK
ncbi:MAG: redoxin domain-containing protein [Prevotellaceae bacterium]|jgi:peroxiredoxin|nr:redoxin domain-containing protein [Prevotellaceae bacterium]